MSCDRAGPALSTHRGDANDAERPDGVRWKPARGGGGGGCGPAGLGRGQRWRDE